MQNKAIGLVNRSVFCGSIQEEALSFGKEIKKKERRWWSKWKQWKNSANISQITHEGSLHPPTVKAVPERYNGWKEVPVFHVRVFALQYLFYWTPYS